MADLRRVARRKARKYGLDPGVFERQIQQESRFKPTIRSPAGAAGVAQIMPGTARAWGVDPLKPRQALDAAARNMAAYVKKYGYEGALRAYNAGEGNIERSKGFSETNHYVDTILHGRSPDASTARPRGGGRRELGSQRVSATGSGTGQVQVPVDTSASTAALDALSSVLAQPQAAPSLGALPVPAFAASARMPAGYQPPQVSAPQAQQGPDVGAVLQALASSSGGQMVATRSAQSSASDSALVPANVVSGGGGKLLTVGDSLGEGTSRFLKGRADTRVGRTSTDSVASARRELRSGRFGRVLLDFGSNDGSVGQLVASVKRAQRLAPDSQIFVLEIHGGPDAAAKTQALKRIKGVTVVPWSTPLGPDGVHPTDYRARAREIKAFIGSGGASGRSGGRGGANVNLRPHGGWGGSEGPVKSLGRVAAGLGLQPTSTKRNNTNPYSGKGSDHDFDNKTAYATDFSNSQGQPTPEMDEFAFRVMRALGFKHYRKGTPINTSQGVTTIDGVRYQVIYRGSGAAFGGNHLNHVHVGARRVR